MYSTGLAQLTCSARATLQTDVLAVLKQRIADGVCTAQDLEGVGNTAVSAPECADVHDKCASLIAAGLSCETDFCVECAFVGQCDLSCNLCGGKRRVQAAEGSLCPPDTFAAQAQSVTEACCDPGGRVYLPASVEAASKPAVLVTSHTHHPYPILMFVVLRRHWRVR